MKVIDWNRIERTGLYLSLLIYSSFQIASFALPSVSRILPEAISQAFLGTSLLLAVHYLIRLIEGSNTKSIFKSHSTYTDAFQEWLEPYESVKDLQIAAYTSHTFVEFLRLQPRRIKKVRLLLLCADEPDAGDRKVETGVTPRDIDSVVPRWKLLHTDKKIGVLEIRLVKSNASFYVSIANRQSRV